MTKKMLTVRDVLGRPVWSEMRQDPDDEEVQHEYRWIETEAGRVTVDRWGTCFLAFPAHIHLEKDLKILSLTAILNTLEEREKQGIEPPPQIKELIGVAATAMGVAERELEDYVDKAGYDLELVENRKWSVWFKSGPACYARFLMATMKIAGPERIVVED